MIPLPADGRNWSEGISSDISNRCWTCLFRGWGNALLSCVQRPASSARKGTRLANGDSDASTISGRIGEGDLGLETVSKISSMPVIADGSDVAPSEGRRMWMWLAPERPPRPKGGHAARRRRKRETVLRLARIARFQPNFQRRRLPISQFDACQFSRRCLTKPKHFGRPGPLPPAFYFWCQPTRQVSASTGDSLFNGSGVRGPHPDCPPPCLPSTPRLWKSVGLATRPLPVIRDLMHPWP